MSSARMALVTCSPWLYQLQSARHSPVPRIRCPVPRRARYVFKCSSSARGLVARSNSNRVEGEGILEAAGRASEEDGGAAEAGSAFGGDGDDVVVAQLSVEKDLQLLHLREVVRSAQADLERARSNSRALEAEAQRFAERAIAFGDEAANALAATQAARGLLQTQLMQQSLAKEAVEKAGEVLASAKARIKVVEQELEHASEESAKEQQAMDVAWLELQKCEETYRNFQLDVTRMEESTEELENEISRMDKLAEAAKEVGSAADDDVAKAMSLAEKAVAVEVDAAQRLSNAEIALHKAESQAVDTAQPEVTIKVIPVEAVPEAEDQAAPAEEPVQASAESSVENGEAATEQPTVAELSAELEKAAKELLDNQRPEIDDVVKLSGGVFTQKSEGKAPAGLGILKSFTKKSSRFFPASFFSCDDEAEEFSPSSVFSALALTVKENLPKLLVGGMLLVGGGVYLGGKMDKVAEVMKSYELSINTEEVTSSAKPIMKKLYRVPSRIKALVNKLSSQEVNEEEASLFDVLWLLLTSVVFVPIFQKIPGGSPVLGYLAAGVLIGPHSLHIIRNVHGTKAIAEFGVVFLLFNIGLELSVERLSSMRKYVFGFGSTQVLATALASGLFAYFVSGVSLPAAIVIGNGIALSSTAVVLQVLQERGESTSRHGRAAFSVLLFQDLAVVVLLILIPLLSPNSSRGGAGLNAIAEALGIAAVKGVIAISGIIAGGRLLLRPIYRSMAENHNAEIFAANTLLVVLGTSVLTARAGLSMALGAFLAGLLLSETEFALQVESDIAPYRGLLLGLFFMTVGMSIDPQLFVAKTGVILGSLALLIFGKALLIACLGRQFGLSNVAALRAGLLLAPGGEFAFVAFGEAVNQGIMTQQLSSLLFLVVGLSMAITPWLAAAGQVIASKFEQQDVRSLLPDENETDDLQGHMIVCGFGRVGQIISQMLSERLIPFVALDVRSERVSMGRALDLPVYFGDAGSREVLHKLGAHRAAAAVITLDTPGANYRAVWALSKYFPNVRTYVRAHDVDHGINLEKAGATAVVPETLEPSLQLAAAVLAEAKLPASEIAATINEFRTRHLAELTELTKRSGTSLGYGYFQTKPSKQASSEDEGKKERRFEGVAVP